MTTISTKRKILVDVEVRTNRLAFDQSEKNTVTVGPTASPVALEPGEQLSRDLKVHENFSWHVSFSYKSGTK